MKNAAMPSDHDITREPKSRGWVMVARMFWMFLGPIVLACIAFAIATAGTGWLTWLDVAFLAVLSLMAFARWYELRSGQGCDSYGNPAGLGEFPRYCRSAIPLGLAVWIVANLFGNHWLD